jgi:hypothetical protein
LRSISPPITVGLSPSKCVQTTIQIGIRIKVALTGF